MGNDIEIRIRVANSSAAGLTSFNQSMQRVKDNARDAGRAVDGLSARAVAAAAGVRTLDGAVQDLNRSLRTLRGRAAAADASLRDLRDASTNSSNSLRGLNARAQTTATRLGDLSNTTRTLRSDSDDLDGSMRRLTGTLGGLRGNIGTVRMSTSGASGGMQNLRKAALLLAPALIPIATQAAPIAASLGAAGVAVGVFGLALGGQIAVMAKASAAEKKYRDTVEEHGKASEEAVKAEADYLRQVRQMDPATRRAAAAFTVFKDQYKQWSSSLAGDTMPVVTKGLATFGALLPKLSPLVRGTSEQLDRLMAVAAGGIQSAGFERFMQSFSEFASGALSRATLGLVKFSQALDAGKVGGGLHEFMQFVRETGPLVGETLRNLGQALGNLVVAASDAGVGILTAVNALAKLVNAVPAEALSAFVQLYATLKLVRLGIAGVSAVATAGAVANLTGFVRAARFAGVGSAIAGVTQRMSTLQKVGGSLGVLGVAALAIDALADKARGAPPDLDKMTASLKALAVTGKFTGELKSTFGDMDGFTAKLGKLKSESAAMEKVKPYLAFSGLGAFADTAVTKLDDLVRGTKSLGATKDDFKVFDEGFADLAKNGYADEAAEQFKVFETAMRKANWSTKDINSVFGKYKETVGGLKDVQDLAAKGMGAFGAQAISVQQKLDAQQKSVAGLQQSLHALNNTYLESRGGVRAMEEAIDAASEAIKKNGRTLDDDTAAGRANNAALDAIASSTMKAMEAKYQETGSWEAAMKVYDRGRSALDKATLSATGNKESAKALADQLLKMPDKKMQFKMDKEDAEAGLNAFNAAVKRTPGSKSVTLKTLSAGAEQILESFGLKVKRLPNGKVTVTTKNGQALSGIQSVASALNRLDGKTARTWTYHNVRTNYSTAGSVSGGKSVHDMVGATGGMFTGSGFKRGYADGGLVQGPGTETSDDVPAPWLSKNEFVVNAKSTRKHMRLLRAINDDRLREVGLAKGGKLSDSEKTARKEMSGFTSLSYFGRNAGFKNNEFIKGATQADSVSALVGTMNQMSSLIKRASHGSAETKALRAIGADGSGNPLFRYQRNLESVNKSLEKARDKLDKLKDSAASLSSSVKSGILSGANITKAAGAEDSQVTINTLLSQMTGSAANSKQFSGMLASLKKKGLSGDLIAQIGEAGIEGGGMETAAAVLGGGKNEIKKLNDLQKQIISAAGAAGKVTADAMYGAGIKAAEGLVKGLQKKQDSIEKQMMKIAKSMEKAIKKALGIRSPSKVMEPVGEFAMQGVEVGWTKRLAKGNTMLSGKTPAWASMLNTPRGGSMAAKRADAAAASQSGWGDRPVAITLQIGNGQLGEVILDPLRRAVTTRGGLRATFGDR